jgi:hypothetical protein
MSSSRFIITVLVTSGGRFYYLVLTAKGLTRATAYTHPRVFTCHKAASIRLQSLLEQGWQAQIEAIESAEGSSLC